MTTSILPNNTDRCNHCQADILAICCFNFTPASLTIAKHLSNSGPTPRVSWNWQQTRDAKKSLSNVGPASVTMANNKPILGLCLLGKTLLTVRFHLYIFLFVYIIQSNWSRVQNIAYTRYTSKKYKMHPRNRTQT